LHNRHIVSPHQLRYGLQQKVESGTEVGVKNHKKIAFCPCECPSKVPSFLQSRLVVPCNIVEAKGLCLLFNRVEPAVIQDVNFELALRIM
jgi:hypothetical protein